MSFVDDPDQIVFLGILHLLVDTADLFNPDCAVLRIQRPQPRVIVPAEFEALGAAAASRLGLTQDLVGKT